ncbi:MAG: c-type cytochrome biogenesis protein CcmI [Pseudomonadota bacterium]
MFWFVAGCLALMACALVLAAFARRRSAVSSAEADVAFYRDQLTEIEKDRTRGVLSEEEANRTHAEVARKLLRADQERTHAGGDATAPAWLNRAVAGAMLLTLIAGTLGLYQTIGAPGYPDLPLANRLAQAEAARADRPDQRTAEAGLAAAPPAQVTSDYADLVAQLRDAVRDRPDEPRGLELLARAEANLGNFVAAHAYQARLIRILGADAAARHWVTYADLLVQAAGGYVSPEAEAALLRALSVDPDNGIARYYSGLLYAQTGRPDLAFRIWRDLLAESPPDARWVPPIVQQIEDVAWRAGVDFQLPDISGVARGPTAADIAAAAELDSESRAAMIRSMVAGLNDRLATEGGPPEDWARLIRSYAILGELEAAAAIWTEAQEVFRGDRDAIVIIAHAAVEAGVE